jgi:hypothetical protein
MKNNKQQHKKNKSRIVLSFCKSLMSDLIKEDGFSFQFVHSISP